MTPSAAAAADEWNEGEVAVRAFVTGGTGFTGAALTMRLLDEGWDVHVLDVAPGLMLRELRERGATVTIGDMRDRNLVEFGVSGADVVFHLAAAFRAIHLPDRDYYQVNVTAMRTLCEASIEAGVKRFVYCSTCGVHGGITSVPATEDSPIEPNDYYQETKWLGEKLLQEFDVQTLPWSIIRPLGIYGPGDPGRFLMLYRFAEKGRFPMLGNGSTLFHPVYIDNLVDSFLLAAENRNAVGGIYLIGDEEYISLNDLVHEVGRSLGRRVRIFRLPFAPVWIGAALIEGFCKPFGIPPPLFRRRVDWYRLDRAFSIERAKSEIGYRPRIDLREGLARTAEWYRTHGYLHGSAARTHPLPRPTA